MRPENVLVQDIDQVLAGGLVSSHMKHYDERLAFYMSRRDIETADNYPQTFAHPLIEAYRQQNPDILEEANWPIIPRSITSYTPEEAEHRFQEARQEVRTSKDVHLNFKPMQDSVEGLHDLLDRAKLRGRIAFGGYYTVRPDVVREETITWLQKHQYPEGGVVICHSPADKLVKIMKAFGGSRIVLIDDSYEKLATAAHDLVKADPELREKMSQVTIAGFGNREFSGAFYPDSGLEIVTLPSWCADDREEFYRVLFERTGIEL